MLVEDTTVPVAALPMARFRDHLRLGSGFDDDNLQDGLLEGFLRAAMAAIEGRTGKILIARQFSWTIPAWRLPDRQALPVAPVAEVIAVAIVDAGGTETAFPETGWKLVPDPARPVVQAGGMFPAVPWGGAARLVFVAGFGADFTDLPPDLQQAMLMLAAHYYEYRQDVALGAGCMPFGVTALIERFRSFRLSERIV